MRMVRPFVLLTATLLAGTAFAAGGGGGGGGSMPSMSVPQYDPTVEYSKGVAALKANDYKAAKTAFDRVISAAPKDANVQYLAGMARVGLNDWKGAKRFFEKAAKLDPKMTSAWQQLGIAQAKTGDTAKAGETLAAIQSKATACGTCSDASALKAAADAVSAAISGKPTAMIETLPSLLLARGSDGDARYVEAVSLINENRFDDAIASLKLSQQSFGPHPDILTYLGFANRKLKRFDLAEDYYRQALAVAPKHLGATEYFGELMVERGDMAGARQMLATLDAQCRFGCAEADELRRWIDTGRSPHS